MIDLCVINYNTKDKLERLVSSLTAEGYKDCLFNLLIADNGSTDGSVDWLKESPPGFARTMLNENVGYSAACNQLAYHGSGDIIGLLNADVWFNEDDILAIQKSFDDNPSQAIMGPKQRDEAGYITHAGIFGPNTAPKHRGWKQYDPEDKLFRDRQQACTVSGSAYFVRRSVWEEMTNHSDYQKVAPGATGAFLPTPHYYEETWCSYFARHLGYEVWYDGTISIGHSWHASSKIGGHADGYFKMSQKIFRQACDTLGIERD